MTAIETDDLYVIIGPLVFIGSSPFVDLIAGEVVRALTPEDGGDVWVLGFESGNRQYIAASSLTPLSDFQADDTVQWGETPYVTLNDIHDYVYEGPEE